MFYQIINQQLVYNFQKSLDFITNQGQKTYGQHFRLYPEDMPIIRKLFAYLIKDAENTIKQGLDPRKGILLCGPIGAGKTSLMMLMRQILPPANTFIVKPCRDVSFEFQKDGFEVIHRYSKKSFNIQPGSKIPKTICFDDLGAEQNLKHFGSQCNVMNEILHSRYELFITDGLITHLTTNLNATEIEKQYGARIRSRLREMMNIIAFPDHTIDKRR